MPATPLSATSRFIEPGVTQYYWVPTILAATKIPTRIELNAGTDLTGEIAEDGVEGFQVTSETVDAPDLGTRFTSKVSGRITAEDSSLTFYRSDDSDDVRTLLPRDTEGFVVKFPEGDVATQTMDVFPVKVTAQPKPPGGSDPAKIMIQFAVTSEPVENEAVPADI